MHKYVGIQTSKIIKWTVTTGYQFLDDNNAISVKNTQQPIK